MQFYPVHLDEVGWNICDLIGGQYKNYSQKMNFYMDM